MTREATLYREAADAALATAAVVYAANPGESSETALSTVSTELESTDTSRLLTDRDISEALDGVVATLERDATARSLLGRGGVEVLSAAITSLSGRASTLSVTSTPAVAWRMDGPGGRTRYGAVVDRDGVHSLVRGLYQPGAHCVVEVTEHPTHDDAQEAALKVIGEL